MMKFFLLDIYIYKYIYASGGGIISSGAFMKASHPRE
jgi:hypothetical protein